MLATENSTLMAIRRRYIATSLVVIPFLTGCGMLPEAGKVKLREADREYAAGQYDQATHTLDEMLRDYPRYTASAEGYYIRALCHIQKGRRSAASDDLSTCLRLSRNPQLISWAHACLGGMDFEESRYDAACDHFAEAITHLPTGPDAAVIHYRYGISLQRIGQWEAAAIQFSRLLTIDPRGPYSDDARRRFNWRLNAYSIQCGVFSNRGSADDLVKRLNDSRLTARRETESRDGRPVNVVYVGRYRSYDLAQAALATVRRSVPDALVVP